MQTSKAPPRKLGYGPLAILEWLCEAGEGERLLSVPSGGGPWLFEALAAGPDGRRPLRRTVIAESAALKERFGGRATVDVSGLTRIGFEHYQEMDAARDPERKRAWTAFAERYDTHPFGYTHSVWVPGPETFRYWQDGGKADLEAMRTARARERERSARLVLIKAPWTPSGKLPDDLARLLPRDFRLPLAPRKAERAYALARVVRETPTRLYVAEVERLSPGAGWSFADDPVRNSADGPYVEPGAVMMDHADRRAALAIAAVEEEHAAEADAALAETLRRIAPALLDLSSLLAQREARRVDEIRGIAEAPGEARTDADEADKPGP